jgi:shikimate kinase
VAEGWHGAGEDGFRRAEAQALRRALAADRQVIACGGGTPTAPGALELLAGERAAARARTVYLRATAPTLSRRLSGTPIRDRPSLTGAGTLEEIPAVLADRDPLYLRVSDLVIDTQGLSIQETAALIAAAAEAHVPATGAPPP